MRQSHRPQGIFSRGTSTLNNTIVAANSAGTPNDVDGAVASSSSHNLIGVDTNLSGISNGSNGTHRAPLGIQMSPPRR